MGIQEPLDLAGGRNFGNQSLVSGHLLQVFPNGFLHKQALGILRQHSQGTAEELSGLILFHRFSENFHLAPVGSADAADGPKGGGFTGTIAAYNGIQTACRNFGVDIPENIGAVFFIPEPQFFHGKGGIFDFSGHILHRDGRYQRCCPEGTAQPVSAFPDRQGAIPFPMGTIEHPDRSRHSRKHIIFLFIQQFSDVSGGIVCNDTAAVHDDGPVCIGEDILQSVLRDDDGGAQFHIDLADRIQKIRCGNGIQLAGGFIQNQHLRLHGHDGSQVQQLLLTAGQVRYIPVKPVLDTEIAGHFRNSCTHCSLITPQRFQAKSQLVPDFVSNNLIIRILHHIADFHCLVPGRYLFQRNPIKEDLTGAAAVGRQHRLQMPQQGGLAGAGFAAQNDIFALLYGKVDFFQRFMPLGSGVGKAQILDLEMCH